MQIKEQLIRQGWVYCKLDANLRKNGNPAGFVWQLRSNSLERSSQDMLSQQISPETDRQQIAGGGTTVRDQFIVQT